jgi:hypothetical protein
MGEGFPGTIGSACYTCSKHQICMRCQCGSRYLWTWVQAHQENTRNPGHKTLLLPSSFPLPESVDVSSSRFRIDSLALRRRCWYLLSCRGVGRLPRRLHGQQGVAGSPTAPCSFPFWSCRLCPCPVAEAGAVSRFSSLAVFPPPGHAGGLGKLPERLVHFLVRGLVVRQVLQQHVEREPQLFPRLHPGQGANAPPGPRFQALGLRNAVLQKETFDLLLDPATLGDDLIPHARTSSPPSRPPATSPSPGMASPSSRSEGRQEKQVESAQKDRDKLSPHIGGQRGLRTRGMARRGDVLVVDGASRCATRESARSAFGAFPATSHTPAGHLRRGLAD